MGTPINKPSGKLGLVTTTQSFNFKSKIKNAIVKFACFGLIPIALADWLIQSGGLTHE
jgi:hypothetical protein